MSENKIIREEQVDELILNLLKGHSDIVKVNEPNFVDLLKHSLSLNTMEKKRVIDTVPTLSQFQFDELIKVFDDERNKFKELAKQHPEDIKKLVAKQQKEWIELWELYTNEKENKEQETENQAKIDDIKAWLWL